MRIMQKEVDQVRMRLTLHRTCLPIVISAISIIESRSGMDPQEGQATRHQAADLQVLSNPGWADAFGQQWPFHLQCPGPKSSRSTGGGCKTSFRSFLRSWQTLEMASR
ncbi:unnamed protein product [Durusdinium trenchii]|uniref:Uncharacterized protein n=1 Tax=Durusdinium trenchii TaxID=1381693 RepID=A0ABP0IJC6_9DINO